MCVCFLCFCCLVCSSLFGCFCLGVFGFLVCLVFSNLFGVACSQALLLCPLVLLVGGGLPLLMSVFCMSFFLSWVCLSFCLGVERLLGLSSPSVCFYLLSLLSCLPVLLSLLPYLCYGAGRTKWMAETWLGDVDCHGLRTASCGKFRRLSVVPGFACSVTQPEPFSRALHARSPRSQSQ